MRVITMKPVHKFVWALMVSLALLLSGCGGSSGGGALGGEDMEKAETQTAALKMAYDAAVAALVTLEDDFSDATQAEIDAVEEKLTALKAAVAAAADVSDEVKAMYSVQAIETRLAAGKKSARLALEAEIAEKARMERAVPQTAALKAAYDAADAALKTLESDASDATRAEVDDVETKLAALKAAVAAAVDVSEEVKAMYLTQTIEDRLTAAKKNARLALEADDAKIAREQTEAAAKAARAETQAARLKAAYDAAVAALATLEDDTDDATQAELKDAKDKLAALKELIDDDEPETGTPDVSDEVKEMYPADTLQTRLDEAEKLARLALAWDKIKVDAETAIMAAGTAIEGAKEAIEGAKEAIEGAETAVEDLNFIHIQTVSVTVTRDVEQARMAYDEARADYDKARAAYDAAKEKHDMDRDAADTTEKVNALKTAADASKMAADAAKTAAETAKTNAEAAKMAAETGVEEVSAMTALQYTDGAYHVVGDTSINPTTIGKAKATEGDKTTGFVEIIGGDSKAVDGVAGTAQKAGQVGIEATEFAVGGKYDSADDDTRLRLITHYVSPGAEPLSLYYFQTDDSETNLVRTTPEPGVLDEATNPDAGYGFAMDSSNKRRVINKLAATDALHFSPVDSTGSPITVGTLPASNLYVYYIQSTAKPLDRGSERSFYFYLDQGTAYQYLHRIRTGTNLDGTTTHVFRKVAYLSAAGYYPRLDAYEHINYGMWSTLDEDGETSADLGVGFVRELKAGGMTTPANMPDKGSATYHGKWVANIRTRALDGSKISEHHGRAKVTAEFTGDRTVTVNLVKGYNFEVGTADADGVGQNMGAFGTLAVLEGTITTGTSQFKGTKVTNVLTGVNTATDFGTLNPSVAGSTGDKPQYTGSFSGAFFGNRIGDEGENASEVGGVFDFTSVEKVDGMPTVGEFRGAFGGVKQPDDDDDS